jgi:DNA-directed RNA polymerase specialized sigma24 family protein
MEDELAKLKAERLQSITREMLDRLNRFSLGRLIALHLPELFAEDLPQEAIKAILRKRRKPKPKNLATPDAWEDYLRSIISSKAEAMTRRIRFDPLPENDALPSPSAPNPVQQAHQSDLKETFFKLLKRQVAPSDQPTVARWEETFEHTDRIPVLNGRRKSTWRVRNHARKVVAKLKLNLTA